MELTCSSETSFDFQRTTRAISHKKEPSLNHRYQNLISNNIVVVATTDVVLVAVVVVVVVEQQ
jgi:hypothetical protein